MRKLYTLEVEAMLAFTPLMASIQQLKVLLLPSRSAFNFNDPLADNTDVHAFRSPDDTQ